MVTQNVPGGLYSRHGTVNLARIGQRLAHLRAPAIDSEAGKTFTCTEKMFYKTTTIFSPKIEIFFIKPAANFKTKTYRDIKYVQNIAK